MLFQKSDASLSEQAHQKRTDYHSELFFFVRQI
jgi:hypothetical protein